MPVHDWTRVDAGTFHDFHNSWIVHVKEALNGGLLPRGFYAQSEQQFGIGIADVLALHSDKEPLDTSTDSGGAAIATMAPPKGGRRVVASPNATFRDLRRTVTIRHVSGHKVVALVEIVSPANKDRESSVSEFVDKAHDALRHGIHVLVIDLLPPGNHDPRGMPFAVWESLGDLDDFPPAGAPLTLASIIAMKPTEAIFKSLGVGGAIPEMPLYLTTVRYINVPLESTYLAAYRGVPSVWRDVLEGSKSVD
jgi:uncharacterized protein DUF4058